MRRLRVRVRVRERAVRHESGLNDQLIRFIRSDRFFRFSPGKKNLSLLRMYAYRINTVFVVVCQPLLNLYPLKTQIVPLVLK